MYDVLGFFMLDTLGANGISIGCEQISKINLENLAGDDVFF